MKQITRFADWRVNKRYGPVVFAFYMSSAMAVLMCLALVVINTGLGPGFWWRFIRSYLIAMPLGFMCVLLIRPLVVKLVALTIKP